MPLSYYFCDPSTLKVFDYTGVPKKKPVKQKIETEPDAWERFEKAVHKIAPPKKAKQTTDKATKR